MTLKEKIRFCEGKNFWETRAFSEYGIPSMFMCDGPHGLRKQSDDADHLGIYSSNSATCFPTAVSTACSWDVELVMTDWGGMNDRVAAFEAGNDLNMPGGSDYMLPGVVAEESSFRWRLYST